MTSYDAASSICVHGAFRYTSLLYFALNGKARSPEGTSRCIQVQTNRAMSLGRSGPWTLHSMNTSCGLSHVHLLLPSSQVRNTSSAFTSPVKTPSTRCDPSLRPCPPPWCPLHSAPCWSSREQRGRRGSRTTWTHLMLKALCLLGQQGAMFAVENLWKAQTDGSEWTKLLCLEFVDVCFFPCCVVELLRFLLYFPCVVLQ